MEVIDWSRLRTKNGKQDEAFELFCYCIAQKKYGHLGKFNSIDGKGGDGGIEFYLELEDGNIWGWQAKFFSDTARLNYGNRKKQISDSLSSACRNHTDSLTKWVLCTNSEFTTGETKWFEETLTNVIPTDLPTELEHWGEDKFDLWLITEPKFNGLRHYFFGELELTNDWFKKQYQVQFASVKDKFIKELHTDNSEIDEQYIQPLLFKKETLTQLQEKIQDAEEKFTDYKTRRLKFDNFIEDEELTQEIFETIFRDLNSFEDQIEECLKEIYKLANLTSPNQTSLLRKQLFVIDALLIKIEKFQQETIAINFDEISDEYLASKKEEKKYRQENGETIRSRLKSNTYYVLYWTRKIFHFLKDRIEANDWHFFGERGIGKTHLSCSIVSNIIDKKEPAIFIAAAKFTSNEVLLSQLKRILDIPESYSVEQFFDALDIAAFSKNVRCPIVIDGINESITESGKLNPIWKNHIPGLIEMISQRNNLVLITTCRPSYEEAIWGEEEKEGFSNRITLPYFNSIDTEKLIRRYFKYYKINTDLTYQSYSSFDKPLHLKIFCEAKNSDRKNDIEIELGDELIYDSFSEFIEICNRNIYQFRKENFSLVPSQKNKEVASVALVVIGKYLWENDTRYIPFDEFYKLMDNDHTNYLSSKTNALINEGLLLCRDFYDGNEVIGITYDMLSGYAIAKYLFQKHKNEIPKFIKSREAFEKLFSNHYSKHHPQYEDIKECFAALLPQEIGKHFYEFLYNGKKYKHAYDLAYEMIFKVSSKFITQKEKEFIASHLEIPENGRYTFELAKHLFCSTTNPFNIKFWSKLLRKISLVERDLSWSEFLRENNRTLNILLGDFEEMTKLDNISQVKEDRTHLIAEYILWSMTTVNIGTRDKASKGLYYYGRRFPKYFLKLLKQSFEINDPVIRERMILIAYGIVLARRYDFKDDSFTKEYLPIYAKTIFKFLFRKKAKYATTHILIRDTGKCIIELAQKHHPNLFSTAQIKRIHPPYKDGGIRDWKELEDKHFDKYQDGNAPIDYYFKKEKIPLIAKGDKHNPNEKMKQATARLFWRITNLGYEYELFKFTDTSLGRYKHYMQENLDKLIKYGEKYATIAFFELAGFLDDNNELETYHDFDPDRFTKNIIDPTFPEPVEKRCFFDNDLLDRKVSDLRKWIIQKKIPALIDVLWVKNLNDQDQDWILLNGSIRQTDEDLQRQISMFPTAIFVKKEGSKMIKKILEQHEGHLRLPGDFSGVSNIYLGEIPHSNLVQRNGVFNFDYKTGTEELTRKTKKIAFFQDGKKLSDEEMLKVFKAINDIYGLNILHSTDSFLPPVVFTTHDNTNKIAEVFKVHKITERIEETNEKYTSDIEDSFLFYAPICKEHSRYLSKDLLEHLELLNQPQSYNLYEKNGQLASLLFEYGDDYINNQSFIYLRKDLLDRYLDDNEFVMLQVITCERMQYSEPWEKIEELAPHYKVTNKIYEYDSKM